MTRFLVRLADSPDSIALVMHANSPAEAIDRARRIFRPWGEVELVAVEAPPTVVVPPRP